MVDGYAIARARIFGEQLGESPFEELAATRTADRPSSTIQDLGECLLGFMSRLGPLRPGSPTSYWSAAIDSEPCRPHRTCYGHVLIVAAKGTGPIYGTSAVGCRPAGASPQCCRSQDRAASIRSPA